MNKKRNFRIDDIIVDYTNHVEFDNKKGGWVYKDGNRDNMIKKRFPHLLEKYRKHIKNFNRNSNIEADLSRNNIK